MYRVQGTIEGTAPILFNRMTENTRETLGGNKPSGGKYTEDQRIQEAMDRCYRNGSGLYLPPWNLKKCMLQGCVRAGLKEGRASMMTYLEASVFVEGDLLFGKDNPDFIHECVGRIPPKTGAAAIIRRPALSPGWRLPFRMIVVDDRRPAEAIRRSIEEAGMIVGLGAWRPEYGRFVLTEWEVLSAA